MLSLISDDPIQRAQLSTFRSIGSMGGALLTGMLIPVIIYDNQNNLRGEQMFVIALIMGVIGLICFRFMVTNTKVRVDTTITLKEDAPKFNIVKAFNNFIHNRPAVGATLAPIATFIGMYGASTAGQILFQAYFKNAKISGIVGMISYFGVFIFLQDLIFAVSKITTNSQIDFTYLLFVSKVTVETFRADTSHICFRITSYTHNTR